VGTDQSIAVVSGPLGVRALARALGWDVKRVHEDAHKLVEIGLVEKDAVGKLFIPFSEIRADFVLRSAA
jgi:predicted transcriptional regulator